LFKPLVSIVSLLDLLKIAQVVVTQWLGLQANVCFVALIYWFSPTLCRASQNLEKLGVGNIETIREGTMAGKDMIICNDVTMVRRISCARGVPQPSKKRSW
jgi:hypothetical protein